MKKKSILSLLIAVFGLSLTTTSCEDMLTPDVDNIAEGFTGRDTVGFYFGILSTLQDVYENNALLGDLRSDLADTTAYVSDTVAQISAFTKTEDAENSMLTRAAYYKVINQCNFYLAKVDTMIQKNNNYYMRREFSQVQVIRAWTYMQLVQNYGSVPYITVPVDNANTGWETNPAEGWVDADNLLDNLMRDGLRSAYEYEKSLGRVSYHNLQNGAMTVAQSLTVFPANLVIADLYLLRGANTADYEAAATYYYEYLEQESRLKSRVVNSTLNVATQTRSMMSSTGTDTYVASPGTWGTVFMDRGSAPNASSELSTLVLSAANSTFGTVMIRNAQLYGFDTSSSNTTSEDTSDDSGTSISGAISVKANYRHRQIAASRRYTNLNTAQDYRLNTSNSSGEVITVNYAEGAGDARIAGTVANVRTDVGVLPFVQKRAYAGSSGTYGVSTGAFSFNYTFPVYRLRQIYLRFAEAVNRAGYPRHAFAILRDGLNQNTVPVVRLDSIDSVTNKIVPYLSEVTDGASYIGVDELRRAKNVSFLDFTESQWDNNGGIHEYGCGQSSDLDTLFTYNRAVGERMANEAARAARAANATAADKLAARASLAKAYEAAAGDSTQTNTDPADPDDPIIDENIGEQINAVETLIADEMALETAFEGFRYYDLYRIARHKNNDNWGFATADYGTAWFAWTIARRSVNKAPYEDMDEYNSALFSKLLSVDNWYLQNPIY